MAGLDSGVTPLAAGGAGAARPCRPPGERGLTKLLWQRPQGSQTGVELPSTRRRAGHCAWCGGVVCRRDQGDASGYAPLRRRLVASLEAALSDRGTRTWCSTGVAQRRTLNRLMHQGRSHSRNGRCRSIAAGPVAAARAEWTFSRRRSPACARCHACFRSNKRSAGSNESSETVGNVSVDAMLSEQQSEPLTVGDVPVARPADGAAGMCRSRGRARGAAVFDGRLAGTTFRDVGSAADIDGPGEPAPCLRSRR